VCCTWIFFGIALAYPKGRRQAAMMNVLREIRETLNLNDLMLIMSIALFIPLRQALPLAAQILCKRINDCLRSYRDAGNGRSGPMPIPS
jgi:hypothetical protein